MRHVRLNSLSSRSFLGHLILTEPYYDTLTLSTLQEDMSKCDSFQHNVERDGQVVPGVHICLVLSRLKEFKTGFSPLQLFGSSGIAKNLKHML